MDWIYGIQKALDYVETHLTEEIEYGEVAKYGLLLMKRRKSNECACN